VPRRRPEAPPANATEKRFLEALERVKANQPNHPELKKLAALKPLTVTVKAVAQEAGLSRTLIGHDGCKYPRARAAVLEAMRPVAQPRTAAEVINRKRDEVAALREAVRLRDSVNAALVRRLAEVDAGADREIRRAERRAGGPDNNANHVAGARFAKPDARRSDNVVPLRPDGDGEDG
jgi:hypothetical protein